MKKAYTWLALLAIAATVAATVLVWRELPAQVPLHWNAAGQVDGHGPRAAVFYLPVFMALMAVLWRMLPAISPLRFEIEGFGDTWWFAGVTVLGLLGALQGVLLWGAATGSTEVGRAVTGVLAAGVLLLGNVMGKVRSNFWLGIRTPWTLADERVWYATHRLAGKTMVGGALLALVVVATGLPAPLGLALVLLGVLVPVPYSLLAYRRLRRANPA